MRVFVTGATGFVGTGVVKELLAAGHQVVGLARNETGVQKLSVQGADGLRGDIENLEVLKKGATESDAVIHLAFVHDFSDFAGSCAKDRAAITAMGDALVTAGGNRALVITSGTMMLKQGQLGDEDSPTDNSNPLNVRGDSEKVCLDYAKKGVRAMVVRLPPTTHGPGSSGFLGMYISIALQQGTAAYIGSGENRWCAGHRDDAASIYRLAVEKGQAGSIFHAVGEQGVQLKDIATEVGKHLNLPVQSIDAEKGSEVFGWFVMGMAADNLASSTKTQEQLGWSPVHPQLLADVPPTIEYVKANPRH